MTRLHIGGKVQIVSAIPGFHLQKGVVAAITEPFVAGESAREEALRELRLYVVRLDDGRHFRFSNWTSVSTLSAARFQTRLNSCPI